MTKYYKISEEQLKIFKMLYLDYNKFIDIIDNIKQQPLKPRKLAFEEINDGHFTAPVYKFVQYDIEWKADLNTYGIYFCGNYIGDATDLDVAKSIAQNHFNQTFEEMTE